VSLQIESIPEVPARGSEDGTPPRRPSNVLVLFEASANGAAALRDAAQLSGPHAQLTVVTLAPQSVAGRCCQRGPGVEVLNCVVREEADRELDQARAILGDAGGRATFTTLAGAPDPPLAAWAAGRMFDLIVLPKRRLALGGHPFARRLRRATTAELHFAG